MQTVALARHAMATRFEIVLHGEDPVALRAAGEEALDEVERLENQLSLYRPTSEIAHLNARAARERVRVEPGLFRLLQQAKSLHEETAGAFDITIAPLIRCWGFMGGAGSIPSASELAAARAKVGMHLVQLDLEDYSVRFQREGVMLDLGAIGKGYAIERAAALLREAGVTRAILHGGTSTIYAIGSPPDAQTWNVAIEYPDDTQRDFQPLARANKASSSARATPKSGQVPSPARPPLLAIVPLKDEALSVSAVWGKSFQSGDKTYGHVLDPRTGRPVSRAMMAAVVLSSATETDALSTALLTAGIKGHDAIGKLRPGMRSFVVESGRGKQSFKSRARGILIHDGSKQGDSDGEKQR